VPWVRFDAVPLDPRTPVLVGVGQVTLRPSDRHEGDPPVEPLDLMERAARAAIDDAGGSTARLVSSIGSIRVVRSLQWNVPDPGSLVADRLGASPTQSVLSAVGGNTPQALMADTATAIAAGRLDAAIVVGAECGYARATARRAGEWLTWTEQDAETPPAIPFGSDRAPATELESARGLMIPVHVYPLIENAIRMSAGWTLSEHRERIGSLWSRFSQVAATNPYAWSPTALSAEEIVLPGPKNRMIGFPYPKLCTANIQVDQGAAYLCCAAATAEAAGVPKDRWVFPLSSAEANDHWFLSERAELARSPAIRLAGASALGHAGVGIDDLAFVDLYSCFPCVVQIAARELGLAIDGDVSRLTLTGGLTFGGGPGNNYTTHGIASLATALRERPGSVGVATGLGWFATKHAVGVYATEPPSDGFVSENVQSSVDALEQWTADEAFAGACEVESFTVLYDRDGAPERGIVACRIGPGRRTWANVTDPDQLGALTTEEQPGWSGTVGAGGVLELAR
jgi:acetyl-CoA C-acetyltransferase